MRRVALMPLRGGSKSIPLKNIRRLAGRPLFAWSLEAALESGCFEEVCVATDSEAIRDCVLRHFPRGVTVIERSPASATDEAPSETVLLEFRQRVAAEVYCLVQATSPLTTAADFRSACDRLDTGPFDSLLTAVSFNRFIWSADGRPLNYDPARRPLRQDSAPALVENGAFYLVRDQALDAAGNRLGGRIGIHVMAAECLAEVDEPEDWITIGRMLQRHGRGARWLAGKALQALVVDVDGTLTDGGMYYGGNGELEKKFHTRDGHGLALLRELGIRVCVISGEDSPAAAARMRKLGITDYLPGIRDKHAELGERLADWKLSFADVGYMGDDLPDLECLRAAGVSFCPADAIGAVRDVADYVCELAGGRGAVREVTDLIAAARCKT